MDVVIRLPLAPPQDYLLWLDWWQAAQEIVAARSDDESAEVEPARSGHRLIPVHMRVVGIRELKRSLSETLHAVSRGEHVRVTLRGRPVADIVPAGAAAADDRLRRLVAEGRLVPPARARPERAPRLLKAVRPASAIVLAEREVVR